MHYFFCITNDAGIEIAQRVFYHLNPLNSSLTNISKLSIKSKILANRTNIQRNTYAIAIVRNEINKNIKFYNYINLICYFDKLTILTNKHIPTISKGYVSNLKSYHTLKKLVFNSNCKKVCDQIHLILLLNKL